MNTTTTTTKQQHANDEIRAEYDRAFDALTYDNASDEMIAIAMLDKLRGIGPVDAQLSLHAIRSLRIACAACSGTGTRHGSACFRCRGRGFQTWQDGVRNMRADARRCAA